MNRRTAVVTCVGLLVACLSAVCAQEPAELVPQSGDGPPLRDAFNAAEDKTRLMVLLSPT